MTFKEFKDSLSKSSPPPTLSKLLQALWYEGKNDWETSHNIAQDIHTAEGSWIHAYLHRKEGDIGNASYWYRKAGKPIPDVSSGKEWELITNELLSGE
jgi:hypothetical protein